MKKKEPFFSIVVPTLNEEKYLPRLLKCFAKQSFHNFEVIIVDGSSDDNTVKNAGTFAKNIQLNTYVIPRKNVATQRNYGSKLAQANWIIFMDADDQIPPTFFKKLKESLAKKPKTDFFTCWMKAEHPHSHDEKMIASTYNVGLYITKLINKPTAVGAFIGVKRKIVWDHPFNESLKVFDDSKFVETLSKENFIFTIFRTPQYSFCFRRFKKNGLLKLVRFYAECNIYTILGKDLSVLEKKYPMNGGADYNNFLEQHFHTLYHFENKINQISKKQLRFIKDLIDSVRTLSRR